MTRFKVSLGFLAIGVGLALMTLGQPEPVQAEEGRDFPRCVQSCNETRTACKTQCDTDCAAIYPAGAEQDACNSSCDSLCISNSQECKGVCQNIKNPPSEQEP